MGRERCARFDVDTRGAEVSAGSAVHAAQDTPLIRPWRLARRVPRRDGPWHQHRSPHARPHRPEALIRSPSLVIVLNAIGRTDRVTCCHERVRPSHFRPLSTGRESRRPCRGPSHGRASAIRASAGTLKSRPVRSEAGQRSVAGAPSTQGRDVSRRAPAAGCAGRSAAQLGAERRGARCVSGSGRCGICTRYGHWTGVS